MVSPAACISLVDVVHVLRQSGTVLPLVVRQAGGGGEEGGGTSCCWISWHYLSVALGRLTLSSVSMIFEGVIVQTHIHSMDGTTRWKYPEYPSLWS